MLSGLWVRQLVRLGRTCSQRPSSESAEPTAPRPGGLREPPLSFGFTAACRVALLAPGLWLRGVSSLPVQVSPHVQRGGVTRCEAGVLTRSLQAGNTSSPVAHIWAD